MGCISLTYTCALLLLCQLTLCQHDDDVNIAKHADIQTNSHTKMSGDLKEATIAQALRIPTWKRNLFTVSPALRRKRQAEDELNAEYAEGVEGGEDEDEAEGEGDEGDNYGDDADGGDVKVTKPQKSKAKKIMVTPTSTPLPPTPQPPAPPMAPIGGAAVNLTAKMTEKPATPRVMDKTNKLMMTLPEMPAADPMTTRPSIQKRNMIAPARIVPDNKEILKTTNTSSINLDSKDHYTTLEKNTSRAASTNQPPIVTQNVNEMVATAGKTFRHILAKDMFFDPEDATNLTLNMYQGDNTELSTDSWIQFLPKPREIYGLPLEAHIDRWNFTLVAQDSGGLLVSTAIVINVRKYKDLLNLTHKFILMLRLNELFTNALDWQIRALEGIVNLYKGHSMDLLTILSATEKEGVCEIVWTNDTLFEISKCPMGQVLMLWKVLANDSGAPSIGLVYEMKPELKVLEVHWEAMGTCATPPAASPHEYPPEARNQIGLLTATAGHLFTYKIPAGVRCAKRMSVAAHTKVTPLVSVASPRWVTIDAVHAILSENYNTIAAQDTFVDPEDGNTRRLGLLLKYIDRTDLLPNDWLQFNPTTQEIYGLPTVNDVGSIKYQLIAEDSSKNRVYDNLVVKVVKPPPINPTATFHLTMDYPYEDLLYSTKNKRRVVEKLASLFGQKDTENIRIDNIVDNPTTVIWYNTSLPEDRCPEKQIEELKSTIDAYESDFKNDDDLKFTSLVVLPSGFCKVNTEEQSSKNAHDVEFPNITFATHFFFYRDDAIAVNSLMSFILPAINILCLILITAVFASLVFKGKKLSMPESYPRIRVIR